MVAVRSVTEILEGGSIKVLEVHLVAVRSVTEVLESTLFIVLDFNFVMVSTIVSIVFVLLSLWNGVSLGSAVSGDRSFGHGGVGEEISNVILEAHTVLDVVHGGGSWSSLHVHEVGVR